MSVEEFAAEIERFDGFGKETQVLEFSHGDFSFPVYVNEFWTSRQRAAHSLHEISYRACFKPQLPRFFIERLTRPGDAVYDPFMGRGTTVVETALRGRRPAGCDVNPLSSVLVRPRLSPPDFREVAERLRNLKLEKAVGIREELLEFYHPDTLRQIMNLRNYLLARQVDGAHDSVDGWICMVATSRLTGHSPGFFSVYTLPPNQAVSVASQRKINEKRGVKPPRRDVRNLILRKTRSLQRSMRDGDEHALRSAARHALLLTGSSHHTPRIDSESIQLVVTSPPFLDTVDYQRDNWLRCWFNGIDADGVEIWHLRNPDEWQAAMTGVFRELRRVLAHGGFIAFEVGEVRQGSIELESLVAPAARDAGLEPMLMLINDQIFTKTSNCWGVDNLKKGTNSNRIVLIGKP